MKTATMVLLHSIETMSGTDSELSEQIWRKTSELLLPNLGKMYTRFEPADAAWDTQISAPYGVVLGRSDPKTFLMLYVLGRERQEEAAKYHIDGFLSSVELGDAITEGNMRGFVLNPKEDAKRALSAHLFWHVGMMGGELLPDAGIYCVPARQAVIGEALDKQILQNIGHYALSAVRFFCG